MKTKLNTILTASLLAFVGAAAAQSTTMGTGTTAQTGVAIGNNATQANFTGDFETGAPVNYAGGIAIGNGTFAAGKNIALGDGLSAIQDGIPNSYSLVIGGLNYMNGQIEYRRVVGMAAGMFGTDGANLQQVWGQAAITLGQANAYTDSSLFGINSTLVNHGLRLGNVEALSANNVTRLDQHDVVLAGHDQRITTAQTTADTALTTATVADGKATVAINQSGQALAIAQETQQEVAQLTDRMGVVEGRTDRLEAKVDGMQKDIHAVAAMGMAATASINSGNLAPGKTGVGMALGGFRSQGAAAVSIKHVNYAGQTLSATVSSSRAGTGVGVGAFIKF